MKQTRKRRILIVDDSKMNREILTGILEDEYHAGTGWIRRAAGDAAA